MCGRYVIYDTGNLATRFGAAPATFKLEANYNVAPGQTMPVVIHAAERPQPTVEIMKWGLVPHWAKEPGIGYRMINTRAESAFDKPAWRGPIKYRRCLVPARGFYEWQRSAADAKRKQPYYIHPADQELFAFAGVYDTWTDRATGSELWTFSICTTAPNKDMTGIHDRMPVILSPDEEAAWLNPKAQTRDAIEPLLHPYPDGHLTMHPVSPEVNVVRNNDQHLIYPMNSA